MSDPEKPELRPANDNPWYWLATLYGEQSDTAQDQILDEDLNDKNRMAWNRWMAGVLSPEQRAALVNEGFPEAELLPLTPTEATELYNVFTLRSGHASPSLLTLPSDIYACV